jgi:hypothetical protein
MMSKFVTGHDSFDELLGQKGVDTSMTSQGNNVSTSSSKAVLAALRALQDKIRRLELERTQAMDETAQLRHQLQNQEIEFEHAKNKESLNSQKSLQESRHAYDRLLTDKTELEIRIAKLEERNAENRNNSDLLQEKIREVEEEKYRCQMKAKELETEQLQLNLQIDHGHKREKDLTNVLVQETARHDTEMQTLNEKVSSLEEELEMATVERSEAGGKLSELDSLVAQLINLNEALVAKLTGKPPRPVTVPKKKTVSKKSTSRSLPRAATMSTMATDSYLAARSESRRPVHVIVGPGDMDQLRMLHNLYRDRADDLTPGTTHASGAGSTARSKSGKKKASSASTKQGSEPSVTPAKSVKSSMTASSYAKFSSEKKVDIQIPSARASNAQTADESVGGIMNNSTLSTNASSMAMPDFSPSKKNAFDLAEVIASLEEEYEQLGMQYKWLLSSMHECTDGTKEGRYAEELVDVIKRMRQKGDQLKSLKSPMKTET